MFGHFVAKACEVPVKVACRYVATKPVCIFAAKVAHEVIEHSFNSLLLSITEPFSPAEFVAGLSGDVLFTSDHATKPITSYLGIEANSYSAIILEGSLGMVGTIAATTLYGYLSEPMKIAGLGLMGIYTAMELYEYFSPEQTLPSGAESTVTQ